MTYHPALILKKADGGYGVEFPGFPGCVARAGTLDGALGRAEHVLRVHVDEMIRAGKKPPAPVTLESVLAESRADSRTEDAVAVLVRLAPPKGRAVRVNITMDEHLLAQIDDAAKAEGTTRSGFLAAGARMALFSKNGVPDEPRSPAGNTGAAAEDETVRDLDQALDKFRQQIARDERERLFLRLSESLSEGPAEKA